MMALDDTPSNPISHIFLAIRQLSSDMSLEQSWPSSPPLPATIGNRYPNGALPVGGRPGTVAGVFSGQGVVEELVAARFADGKAADSHLEQLSDELEDRIEDDPEFKSRLLASAFATPGFRDKVVKALAKALR